MRATLQTRVPENFLYRQWGADPGARTPIGASRNFMSLDKPNQIVALIGRYLSGLIHQLLRWNRIAKVGFISKEKKNYVKWK